MQNLLLHALSYEHPVSGEVLAQHFGISRAAIHKRIQQLKSRGVLIEANSGQGYQFSYPYQWWESKSLSGLLNCPVHVLEETESTNDDARIAARKFSMGEDAVWVTDFQLAGRGRRGNNWLSLPGRQLTFSYAIATAEPPQAWTGLSLAVGVIIAERLMQAGLPVMLKWPNDLMLADRKLGGILIEMDAQAEGPSTLVIGVGLNEHFLENEKDQLSVPVASLHDGSCSYDRYQLLTTIVSSLRDLVADYPKLTLSAYRARWEKIDYLRDAEIRYLNRGEVQHGRVCGIDAQGALLVATGTTVASCSSTEIEKIRK